MRHSSFLYAGLLSFAAASSVFAAETSAPAESAQSSQGTAKSGSLVKKFTVNANAAQADEEKDPFEAWNRKVYTFNDVLDRTIARPIAVQYSEKVPEDVRGGYHQFRKNLNEPWNSVNQAIQGRPVRALKTLGRFTLNTLTTLGFADPASRLKLTGEEESFGTTLGYYGVPSGPYLMLPIVGPSTIREGFGFAVDSYSRPQRYMLLEDHEGWYWTEQTLRAIDSRSELLDVDKVLKGDKYAQLRDIYLQRINFEIAEKKGDADDSMFISDESDDAEDDESSADQTDDAQTDTDESNDDDSAESVTE